VLGLTGHLVPPLGKGPRQGVLVIEDGGAYPVRLQCSRIRELTRLNGVAT